METLTKTFELPSKGLFGGPTEVTVRPMTTKEEKLLLTSRDNTFIQKIVESCIVEPKGISTNNLHPSDITYLLYMIREMTFGPTYKQQMQCPYCGLKQDIDIDITEMKVFLLDMDELKENTTITLPVCKDVLEIQLLSQGDIDNISKTINRLKLQNKLKDPEGYEYSYRFASLVKTINGNSLDIKETIEYIDNLNLRDFGEIKKALSNIKIGIDTTNIRVCEHCGEEVEVQGVTAPEFFRSY